MGTSTTSSNSGENDGELLAVDNMTTGTLLHIHYTPVRLTLVLTGWSDDRREFSNSLSLYDLISNRPPNESPSTESPNNEHNSQ